MGKHWLTCKAIYCHSSGGDLLDGGESMKAFVQHKPFYHPLLPICQQGRMSALIKKLDLKYKPEDGIML